MENIFNYYVLNFMIIYLISRTYNEKFKIFSIRTQLAILNMTITAFFFSIYFIKLKPIGMLASLIISNWIFRKRNIRDVIISSFVIELLIMLLELISILFITSVYAIPNLRLLMEIYSDSFMSLIIIILLFLTTLLKFPKNFYFFIREKSKHNKLINIVVVFGYIFLVITFSINTGKDYVAITSLIISILILMLGTLGLSIKILEKNNILFNQNFSFGFNKKKKDNYKKIIQEYKRKNHESRNQLLIMKDMMFSNDIEGAKKYLTFLTKSEYKINEPLCIKLDGLNFVPIKSIIFNKFSEIEELKIEYDLIITNNVSEIDEEFSESMIYDITRLLGIYLDNAIDESKRIGNSYIILNISENDDNLIFEISNKFKKTVNLERIDKPGVSSKGKDHGYGLSLANEIIKNNKKIINKRFIVDNMFKQKLYIKYK